MTSRADAADACGDLCAVATPIAFLQPDLDAASPWLGHVPFAFWLVEALAPRAIVELGTQSGISYSAFCQAVVHLGLDTTCRAVDTWKGEEHTGFYGEEVIEKLRSYHDPRYGAFSSLIRSTFDEALPHFSDCSIDLLHIDGLHTYEAVSADFRNWLPKLSDRAVVIFHDINVRERDFGVWRMWDEVSQNYPSFSFLHSHGLGVLAVGSDVPQPLRWLTATAEPNAQHTARVRAFFERLGDRLIARFDRQTLLEENSRLNEVIAGLRASRTPAERHQVEPHQIVAEPLPSQVAGDGSGVSSGEPEAATAIMPLQELADLRGKQLERLRAASSLMRRELEAKLSRATKEAAMLTEELGRRRVDGSPAAPEREAELAQALAAAEAQHGLALSRLYASTSWRLTRPLRAAVRLQRAAWQRDWGTVYSLLGRLRASGQPSMTPSAAPAADSAPLAIEQNAAQVAAMSAVVSHSRPLIAFVSGYPGSPSETYRVLNPISVLEEFFEILPLTENELAMHRNRIEAEAKILVLFRLGPNEDVFGIVRNAQANGCVVIYDVDDLVFEEAIAIPRFVDGLKQLSAEQIPAYKRGIAFANRLIKAVDACTVPTAFLADRIAALGATTLLLPSGINISMLNWFDRARATTSRPADRKVRIGYASGTKTHQADFLFVKDALLQILTSREDVVLTVVGALDLADYPEFAAVEHKIERRELVPHAELPAELMRFDINIAPLELGNPFCESKSELKYFDAAFLEIPTVATPIAGYADAITPGVTGFLAVETDDWVRCLNALLDDRRLRVRIGKQARGDALRRFGPGAVRENTKRAYQQLLAMRRERTPARHKGYDNFLYAINYEKTAALRPEAIKPADDGTLTIHWILPTFSAGAGGVSNILRVIQHLEMAGHRNTIWVHSPWDTTDQWKEGLSTRYKQLINEAFRHIAADVHPLADNLDHIRGDAVVATDHYSVYPAQAIKHVRRRFYFLQDNEAEFSPTGFATLFADATLRFGFDAISNGPWLHELALRHGMWSMQWDQAADPQHYFTTTERRKPGHIAFYARLQTPRRAVELGLLAFELLARWGLQFHVDFFGGTNDTRGLPYSCTNHGVLSADRLGELYRSASIGMVFSSTNYSIIPREMMACGLPVVEIASPSALVSFPDLAAVVLSEPTPQAVAGHLRTLLLDRVRRDQMAEHGPAHAACFSWDKSASDIEDAMISRLKEPLVREQDRRVAMPRGLS